MAARKCLSRKTAKIVLGIGIVLFVISLIGIIVLPTVYQEVLKEEITLKKDTLAFKMWQDIPIPIYERLYFFNITNADDFKERGAKLNVTQVGPYTYKSRWVKHHLHWYSNYTVSYREIRTYHFVPELSSGSEDDMIYSLNGPLIIAANVLKDFNLPERMAASAALGIVGEHIIIHKSIRELSYGGYEDYVIKLAPVFMPDIPFKDGIFLWLYDKNATDDGEYMVFTGEDDNSNLNMLNRYNRMDKLPFWKGDRCNMLNGTSVETGPPLTDSQQTYTFFQSIFCRSLTFTYEKDVEYFGITGKRFIPTFDLFANSTDNPSNECFDINPGMPSGVLDVSSCQFGAPAYLSFPHFQMADPSYLDATNGLSPNAANHTSYVDVEYVTGLTISTAIKLQMNLKITRVEGLFQLDNIAEGVYPIFWVDLQLTIDEAMANTYKKNLWETKTIAYSLLGVLMGVSSIMIIGSFVALIMIKQDDDVPLLDPKGDCRTEGSGSFGKGQSNSGYVKDSYGSIQEGVDSTVKNLVEENSATGDDVPILN